MIAARCPKCNIIGSCICNFGKYELTKEEKDKWDKGVEEMNRQPIQFLNVWKETVNKPTISEFQLSAKEKETVEIYLTKIKKKYGTYGHITYSFTETGIGCCVKIKSSHKNKWKDITDLDRF